MYKLTHHHMPGYVQWLVRWRWVVIIVCLLLVSVAAPGLRYFETTADYRIYFGEINRVRLELILQIKGSEHLIIPTPLIRSLLTSRHL